LIINELVSNSLKYAFPNGRSGDVFVGITANRSRLNLEVCDNGIGMPADINVRTASSLGLQLVSSLADQLDATIELDREGGTKYRIAFRQ
jgi:two-component sensor histidine kinase